MRNIFLKWQEIGNMNGMFKHFKGDTPPAQRIKNYSTNLI